MVASFATDDGGNVLKRHAIEYWKDIKGIDEAEKIVDYFNKMKEHQLDTKNLSTEMNEVDDKLNHLEKEENGKKKKVHLNSPVDKVNSIKGKGTLALVLNDVESISQQAVQLNEYVSYREIKSGVGIPEGKELKDNIIEEALFDEYLLDKCGDYTEKKENSPLQYELEYILYGKGSDRENLTDVVHKLLGVRQVANHMYLWSDSVKRAEADELAMVIASAVCMPEIQPIVKISIMFAWVYAESIGDIKVLLDGGKIPLIKNQNSWRLQLSQLENFQEKEYGKKDGAEGLCYREYIKLFLLAMDKRDKTDHFMNIIEMNIRKTDGNKKFELDGCADYIEAEAECSSKFGYCYKIDRKYDYE